MKKIRNTATQKNIPLTALPCYSFFLPLLKDGKTIDHPAINSFVRATAKSYGVAVDNKSEQFKRVRDGVYASMNLQSPDKLREEAAAKRLRKQSGWWFVFIMLLLYQALLLNCMYVCMLWYINEERSLLTWRQ